VLGGWLLVASMACAAGGNDGITRGEGGAGGALLSTGSGDGGPGDFDACAIATHEAEPKPLNLYIMFDKSGSMLGPKWAAASDAMQRFFMDPQSSGLQVALRFFPDDGCDPGCSISSCAEPMVELGALTELSAPTDTHEQTLLEAVGRATPGGGTPLSAALDGALRFAKNVREDKPHEASAVVLVTDGEPSDCQEATAYFEGSARDALISHEVLTFAIGLEGSDASLVNAIAQAGGTEAGILIGDGALSEQLLQAFTDIRERTVACNYDLPDTAGGDNIDPAMVNVLVLPTGASAPETVPQVNGAEACSKSGGWYYDDNLDPKDILFCPSTCTAVQSDVGAQVELLFGCESVVR